MQLTTLIENCVERKSLLAEHGLSILIDTGQKKILFDTGQTDNFLLNARVLGIDLEDIDYVVLSHGHYDHTGGLYAFLNLNKKTRVICKKEIFLPKYNNVNKFIGLSWNEEILKGRVDFIDEETELEPGIFIMPHTIIHHAVDTHFKDLKVKINDILVEDTMEDELFVALRYEDQLSILTACSHRGISNICKTSTNYFKLPIYSITGGFHLKHSSRRQYNFIVDYFNKTEPAIIGVCHCTGVEKFSQLQRDLKNPVFYNYTGRHINF